MCSADNFTNHIKKSFDLAKNPKDTLNPFKFGKANLGNDIDMFSGNAGKREEWERQRQAQASQSASAGSYTNTYTDADGNRQTYVSGEAPESRQTVLARARRSRKPMKTILGAG